MAQTTAAPVAPPEVLSSPSVADKEAATSRGRQVVLGALVVLAILLGLLVRWNGALVGGDVADVAAYRGHVAIAESGRGIYSTDTRFPYFPGWLGVELAAAQIARAWRIPFWQVIRGIVVAADVLACFALWWAGTRAGGPARGRWAAAIYALSPIAILIAGYHGQFDSLSTLFSVLAAGFLLRRPHPVPAGVLLGIAMALKPFPALLVPVLAWAPGLSWRGRTLVAGIALAIVGVVTGPYLAQDAAAVMRNVGGYGGLNDQGLGGVLRALWYQRASNQYLPGAFGTEISTTTRWFALGAIALTFLLARDRPFVRTAGAVYLAFLGLFGGVSTQYLVWPLPWLLLSDLPLWWAVVYNLTASAGAIGFYLVYWPQMVLPGQWKVIPVVEHVPYFVVGQIVSWLGIVATWFASIGRVALRRWREPLVVAAAAVTIGAAYPVVAQISWFAGEWLKFQPRP
jgi:hypothetical protein